VKCVKSKQINKIQIEHWWN